MDAILTYHTNPLTCGIARFNRALSQELVLPVLQLFAPEALFAKRPLLSLKVDEFSEADLDRLNAIVDDRSVWPRLRLFFHDYQASSIEAKLVRRAEAIYCGNELLYDEMKALHPNVILAWCPGYLFDTRPLETDAEIKIYTFGMAHKLRADYFYQLRDLLEKSGKTYMVYVSAAIHEGKSLDDNFTSAYEELTECFNEKVRFLGFISDGALHHYLTTSTFFAAFFQGGVRANNTSVNTAMHCGAVVLTNLDAHSPPGFAHLQNVIDIRQCQNELPLDAAVLDKVRTAGRTYAASVGWKPLVELFKRHEAALGSTT
jgi:hypothetical protein